MITSAKLRELSITLAMRGAAVPWVEALAQAADEIDTLTFTVEAVTALQVKTALDTMELRRQIADHQVFANERHAKIERYRALLRKYASHVEAAEGTDYLGAGNFTAGNLTRKERDEIVALIE